MSTSGDGRILFATASEIEGNFNRHTFRQCIAKILQHSEYEATGLEKLAAILISILWTRLTLENWRAKLVSLGLAIMVWYLIKQNVATTPLPSERLSPTPRCGDALRRLAVSIKIIARLCCSSV